MSNKIGTVWSELDHQIVHDSKGDIRKVVNIDAVKSSLNNIILTTRGERSWLPEFGSNLRGILFDGVNSAVFTHLSREIKSDIELWDDRINVVEINFYEEPDRNAVSVTILWNLVGSDQIFENTITISGEI
jgi:phage baseplate assembly protein W